MALSRGIVEDVRGDLEAAIIGGMFSVIVILMS